MNLIFNIIIIIASLIVGGAMFVVGIYEAFIIGHVDGLIYVSLGLLLLRDERQT